MPSDSILLIRVQDGVHTAAVSFDLTPEQSVSLQRIGWSLYPEKKPEARPLQVAVSVLAVAAAHPAQIMECIRASIQTEPVAPNQS